MDLLWVDMVHRETFIVPLVEVTVVKDWELNESDHLLTFMKQSTGSWVAAIPLTRAMIIQVKNLFHVNIPQILSLNSIYLSSSHTFC